MKKGEKTDFCDGCFEPWYPRLLDADGEPMENICEDCSEMMEEGHVGLREDDERPPICACGVTMIAMEDDDGDITWACANDNCRFTDDY